MSFTCKTVTSKSRVLNTAISEKYQMMYLGFKNIKCKKKILNPGHLLFLYINITDIMKPIIFLYLL